MAHHGPLQGKQLLMMPVAGLYARSMSFDQVRLQSASPFAAHLHTGL